MGKLASLFRTPKASTVIQEQKPIPEPTRSDPEVEEARRKEIIAAAAARGRASTMLTGGAGDTSNAPVGRRVLLGG